MIRKRSLIAILFWSSRKRLPGYPFLEAALNSAPSASIPLTPGSDFRLHFMHARQWMRKTGLKNVQAKTFAADIQGPFSAEDKERIVACFDILRGSSEQEVSREVWKEYEKITGPGLEDFILDDECYAGFVTYTMFVGEVGDQ